MVELFVPENPSCDRGCSLMSVFATHTTSDIVTCNGFMQYQLDETVLDSNIAPVYGASSSSHRPRMLWSSQGHAHHRTMDAEILDPDPNRTLDLSSGVQQRPN